VSEFNSDDLGGGWTKRSVLDKNTGKFHNRYFFKRRKAHRIIINTPKSKSLAGYTLIEKDLRSAIIWLKEIITMLENNVKFTDGTGNLRFDKNREINNLVKGLFVAALTFYGKCFSQCEGRRVKIDKKNIDLEFHDEHDMAILLRHNFAAHSGAEKVERAKVILALDSKRSKNTAPYIVKELSQPDAPLKSDIEKMIKLFEHVQLFALNKIEVLTSKVYTDDILPKGADYWYGKT